MVRLRAEVLFSGQGCPVCGGQKTNKACTCRACYEEIGPEATKAVDAVAETCAKAAEGNAVTARGAWQRSIVFGSILAQVRIDKDAIHHIANGEIQPYWDCSKSIPGGFVSVYVFGATGDQRGKTVTVSLDIKNKEHRSGDIIHYCRGQVVDGVGSNAKLQIVRQEEAGSFVDCLPSMLIEEGRGKTRKYAVGFAPVDEEAKLQLCDPSFDRFATLAARIMMANCNMG